MKTKTKQLIALILLVVVGIFLYTRDKQSIDEESKFGAQISETELVNKAELALSPDALIELNALKKTENWETDSNSLIEVSKFWDANSNWLISGIYYSRLSKKTKNPALMNFAGNRLLAYYEQGPDTDSLERIYAAEKAGELLEQAFKTDSLNTNFEADYANFIIRTSNQPMKGILSLRNLADKYPGHPRANLLLGEFSLTTGQIDNAIERFNKIISVYPDYPEAYLGLSNAYLSKGDTNATITALNSYKKLIHEPMMINEIDKFINSLIKK